ncbi:hypothetical protein EMIHUDRAFT_119213 [Emiliania huxleyi CCMP1516]|uniref:Kinesin motor domain-containing protein n=2 Tax=Emiliania huxleyi TaxID=2903 RepID=A0A0D3IX74_EMIH1|nr:hypothetical protein EMIHUDRAFT_119213 [Emiliania huxleyi CCMP1516]EOD15859.1 hypothetical protein EMIHUDRAFT_119213 [Emiliania huxleyi CCMP1516]|eukprot:XP_005768288.1 hypothetical protein EMIHUDRAFT_119213 [Emiliania huxleyi CCMP1516]
MGEPLRTVVRVKRAEAGYEGRDAGAGSLFIAGNALELAPPDRGDGVRHSYGAIYDSFASDQDLCEVEVRPLAASLATGLNAAVLVAGHCRSGREALFGAIAARAVEGIFEAMRQRLQAGDQAGGLTFTLTARYAFIPAASTVTTATLELRQEHKGRSAAPDRRRSSSEEASGGGGGGGDADLVSSLLLADVETNALGDGLASGLRQLLSGPGSAHAAHSGPALLLRDAVGGNCKTVLLGTVAPEDFAESCATLQLVAQGAGFVNFPLVNDAHHRWVSLQLQEQLSAAEGRLQHGVDLLEEDRRALPNQLHGAAARLQALVDQMQQDAKGAAGEKQKLMAEVLELRTQYNGATGEVVALKEEVVATKQEKLALSKELVATQLSANEESAAQAEQIFSLEQEAIASADLLAQLQERAASLEADRDGKANALAELETTAETARLEAVSSQAQASSARAEALEAREREDDLALQLLNMSNASATAESRLADAAAQLEAAEREATAQRSRAQDAISEAEAARGEALKLAEEVSSLNVVMERQALSLQQDRLALQRTAVEAAEAQLERSQQAEARADRESHALGEERAAREAAVAEYEAEMGEARARETALRRALADQAAQLVAATRHLELLGGEGSVQWQKPSRHAPWPEQSRMQFDESGSHEAPAKPVYLREKPMACGVALNLRCVSTGSEQSGPQRYGPQSHRASGTTASASGIAHTPPSAHLAGHAASAASPAAPCRFGAAKCHAPPVSTGVAAPGCGGRGESRWQYCE